jgi:Secretion system C-terminal sorting domain
VQNGGTMNANGEFGFDVAVIVSAPRYELNNGMLNINGDAVWFGAAPGSGQCGLIVNNGIALITGSVINTNSSTADVLLEVHGGSLTVSGPAIDLAHVADSVVASGGALHLAGIMVVQNDGVVHATGGDVYMEGQVELRGSGSYRFHNVTVAASASLQHTDPLEIGVGGAWVNQGSFDPDINTVVFVGVGPQPVSSTGFFGLRMAAPSGSVNLVGPSTVSGALTLDAGNIHTQASDLLTLLHGATAADGSDLSYVDGPMRKVGNDAFTFPVGSNGRWRRLGIGGLSDQDTEITAEYFDAPYADTTTVGTGLAAINTAMHWTLQRAVTTEDATVELYWEDATVDENTDCTDLVVAEWDGGAWQGNSSTVTGSCSGASAGSVQSNDALLSFSAYTFGTGDGSSGYEERQSDPGFAAYPNPASAEVTIAGSSSGTEVRIYNSHGQRMPRVMSTGSIDVSGWPNGVYHVIAVIGSSVHAARFVVAH